MKRMIGIIGWAAFFAALGVVGEVEHGAELGRMVWLVPLFAVMTICARTAEQN